MQRNLGANAGLDFAGFARLIGTMAACELRRLRDWLPLSQCSGAELPCHASPVPCRVGCGGFSDEAGCSSGKPCSAACGTDQTCSTEQAAAGSGRGRGHVQKSWAMAKRGPAGCEPACTPPAHADRPHQEGQGQADARLAAVALAAFKLRRAAWVLESLLADGDWGKWDGLRTDLVDKEACLTSSSGWADPEQVLLCPDDGMAQVSRQLVAHIWAVLVDILPAVQKQEDVKNQECCYFWHSVLTGAIGKCTHKH